MSTPIIKKWLAAVLCVLTLGSTAARAEPDSFYLGEGYDGAKTVPYSPDAVVLNSYAQVTANITANSKTISVGSVVGATTSISNNSLIMILETTGITPLPNVGDNTIINLDDKPVGTWELARVESFSGSTLTVKNPLTRAYTAMKAQVIVVPEYSSLKVEPSATVSAQAWDGHVGGVVAFLVKGTFENNGEITASAKGFRGGTFVADPGSNSPVPNPTPPKCDALDQGGPAGARKGEGITDIRYGTTGLGNTANGGGGGVCVRSGGGGGAGAGMTPEAAAVTGVGAGAGGLGGKSGDNRTVGGMGGAALRFTSPTRLTFGGGGGAGHGLTSAGQDAGYGGGIIFVRANQLTGSGKFSAAGGLSNTSSTEAGSGGGGGGTIHLRFAQTASCSLIDASGGLGGSTNGASIGPGGGGGGGYVFLQSAGGACTVNADSISGADAGSQKTTSAGKYGATGGNDGGYKVLPTGFVQVVPVIQTPANGAALNASPTAISGTAEANSTLTLVLTTGTTSTTYGPIPVGADGTWSLKTPTLPVLADGSYSVAVTTTNAQGDTSRTTTSTFSVDTRAPTVAITTPANGTASKADVTTVSGTAEPGSKVTVVVEGTTYPDILVPTSGLWTVTLNAPLTNGGPYTATATAKDAAGNNATATSIFSVDTTPPTVAIVTPPTGRTSSTDVTTISGTAEPGSKVTVVVEGTTYPDILVPDSGLWTVTLNAPLTNGGPYTATATSTDAAGNTATATSTFTVDTQAPAVAITTPANDTASNANVTTVSGTATPGSKVTVVVEGTTYPEITVPDSGLWTVTLNAPLTNGGPYTATATATDAAGNTATATSTFTVDTQAPAAPVVTGPANGEPVTDTTPVITGTAEPNTTVTVIIDGKVVGTAPVDGAGNWNYTPSSPLPSGPHTVTARTEDAAGNTSPESAPNTFTVVIDTSITQGPSGTTTNRSATFEFDSGQPGVTYECRLDGGEWTACTSPVTYDNLPDGEHTFEVRSRDSAGNVDATPATRTWTVHVGDIDFRGDGLGCSASGGDSSLVLMALGSVLALARRRRQR